jgi:rubrerythrin
MKGQPQTSYQMTVTWADGDHRASASGSLRYVLEYISNHVPIQMDSYHKVWRELARTGGAYSSFFPAHPMPMQVVIIEKKLVPAPVEREAAQVIDTIERSRYEHAQDLAAQDVIYQRPDFYSAWGETPKPAPKPVTLECANCGTTVEAVNGQGHCPYCVDMFTEKASAIPFPLHSHPTLTWDRMSKWQRKQYAIKS